MASVPSLQQSEASYLMNLGQDLGEILLSGQPLQGGAEGLRASLSSPLPHLGSLSVLHLVSPLPQFDSSSK